MWFTAIILGLAGSFHCLGMCSPLLLAVTGNRHPFFLNRILYNGGRILTYGILGVAFSLLGSLFHFNEIQTWFSIALGALLLIGGIAGTGWMKLRIVSYPLERVTLTVKKIFSGYISKRSHASIWFLGMINGLLPCGMTFLALTYCATLPTPGLAFFFMLIFGLGTLPVMLGFTGALQFVVHRFQISFRSVTSFSLIGLGCLLIVRSMVHTPGHSPAAHKASPIVVCKPIAGSRTP